MDIILDSLSAIWVGKDNSLFLGLGFGTLLALVCFAVSRGLQGLSSLNMTFSQYLRSRVTRVAFTVIACILVTEAIIFTVAEYTRAIESERRITGVLELALQPLLMQGSSIEAANTLELYKSKGLIDCYGAKIAGITKYSCQHKMTSPRYTEYELNFLNGEYPIGTVSIRFDRIELFRTALTNALVGLGIIFLILFLTNRALEFAGLQVRQEVENLYNRLSYQTDDASFRISEFAEIARRLREHFDLERATKLMAQETAITRQVSHDIRSPLSALNLVASTLDEVSEQKRVLIRNSVQRINDIANDLLNKSKQIRNQGEISTMGFQKGVPKTQVVLLSSIIDPIVSEKRIQLRDQIGINIKADLSSASGAFSDIGSIELGRVLSNLINNSVEALTSGKGDVQVVLSSVGKWHRIAVNDNGIGMPPEVLAQLGRPGFSHGKVGSVNGSGSGLGVAHAKSMIEAWGGQLNIQSELGKGTEIEILLPKAQAPHWFREEIILHANSKIVIVDDDLSIHNLWENRIRGLTSAQSRPEILKFTSAAEFRNLTVSHDMVLLIDFEFLNQQLNGLDLIHQRNLQNLSTLVTSRSDEPQIQEACLQGQVKCLPKSLIASVPIRFENQNEKFDMILLDDDALIGATWQMAAEAAGKKIRWFAHPWEFQEALAKIDPGTPLFIDCNLADGVRGELLATDAMARGFTSVSLATGYEGADIEWPPGLRSVVGKDFPRV